MAMHDDAADARGAALAVVVTLRSAGHVAYFAGGCVRDELLGLEPADYDVATDATPDKITALFERTAQVGASFGVVLVHHANDANASVEVATFRTDGSYSDNRRPDSVQFSDPPTDAKRRDFTVNALFLDPLDEIGQTRSPLGGCVIDHVGGLADLDARIIRAVGNPALRLAEDHLRALRAVRIAARLSFTIEPATAEAITVSASALTGVSRERIGDEIRRMFTHSSRHEAVALLYRLGLDAPVLKSPHSDQPTPTLRALAHEASYPAAVAAWAIDRGARTQPDGGRSVVRDWRRSLCLTNNERDRVWNILAGLNMATKEWDGLGIARQKRAASAEWFADMLVVLAAIDPTAADGLLEKVKQLGASPGGLAPEPFVNGEDLIALGYPPGPRFGILLDEAYDAQLKGRVQSKAQALELVRELGV